MRILVLAVVVTLTGCRCKEAVTAPVSKPIEPKPAHARTSWALHEPSEVPEDVYGVPAWSKVFALAFERKVSVGVPTCAVSDGGCLERDALQLRGEPTVSQDWVLGKDEPIAFIGEQVTFLEEPKRYERLERAIERAMEVDPSGVPVAAVLFQNDLWERVDAITEQIATEPTADWQRLERLRGRLVALMHKVALSKEQLDAIGNNEPAIVRAHEALLAGFAARDGWFEIAVSSTPKHGSHDWVATTRHSERHGFRVVFRVFVHHPAGRGALEAAVAKWPEPLPAGTRFVVTGAPMHLTRDGSLAPAPFITLLETRQALAEGATPGVLKDLPHDVLEGRRAVLTKSLVEAGFERLPRDALIPVGGTCMPDFTTRLPAAAACTMCHGPAGNRLTGPLGHAEIRVSLSGDPSEAGRAVAKAKRSSSTFAVLGW